MQSAAIAPDWWEGRDAFKHCVGEDLSLLHQLLTRQAVCSFFLRGEAFLMLREQGKYDFESWVTFTIRPHPPPAASPSPSKGKAMVRNALILTCFFEDNFLKT